MIELFAIYDAAAERYIEPFPCPTIAVALRSFEEACKTEGHQFRKHPEDYTLFHIGSFDPDTAVLTPLDGRKIGMAMNFVKFETGDQLEMMS